MLYQAPYDPSYPSLKIDADLHSNISYPNTSDDQHSYSFKWTNYAASLDEFANAYTNLSLDCYGEANTWGDWGGNGEGRIHDGLKKMQAQTLNIKELVSKGTISFQISSEWLDFYNWVQTKSHGHAYIKIELSIKGDSIIFTTHAWGNCQDNNMHPQNHPRYSAKLDLNSFTFVSNNENKSTSLSSALSTPYKFLIISKFTGIGMMLMHQPYFLLNCLY